MCVLAQLYAAVCVATGSYNCWPACDSSTQVHDFSESCCNEATPTLIPDFQQRPLSHPFYHRPPRDRTTCPWTATSLAVATVAHLFAPCPWLYNCAAICLEPPSCLGGGSTANAGKEWGEKNKLFEGKIDETREATIEKE